MGKEINTIKLAAHAQGIVFVEVNNKTVKRIVGKSVAQLNASKNASAAKDRPSWESAIAIRKILNEMASDNGAAGWCKPTLSNAFKQRALLKNAESWRTDTQMMLAFQTVDNEIECVGVCSYGEGDTVDRQFNDNVLEGLVAAGQVLEIDLLCSKNGSRGTGTLLLTYCIAKQLSRKSRNQWKYKEVVIPLAGHGNPMVRPLLGPVLRLGFTHEPCGPGPHGQEYIVSLERDDLVLPDLKELEKLCALKPKSGIQYCQ